MPLKHLLWLNSMPKHEDCGCLQLKWGSFICVVIIMVYSGIGLMQCIDILKETPEMWSSNTRNGMLSCGVVLDVTADLIFRQPLSLLMLVGILKEKAKLMKPWIFWFYFQMIVTLLIFALTALSAIIWYNETSPIQSFLLVFVLDFMIRFHFLAIVTSFYRQLEKITMEENKEQQYLVDCEDV